MCRICYSKVLMQTIPNIMSAKIRCWKKWELQLVQLCNCQVKNGKCTDRTYRFLHRTCATHDKSHNSQLKQKTKLTKTQRNIFLVFYQIVGVQQKFNIDYIQLSRLDFIHFILMHSQKSQFQLHAKINSQKYSNPIPSNFESMITHQVPFP